MFALIQDSAANLWKYPPSGICCAIWVLRKMDNNYKKTILITGGTRGIGAAIADAFEDEAENIILTGTNPEQIELLNKSSSPKRKYMAVDFSDEKSIGLFLDYIEQLNRLDVCVNNAGINIIKSIDEVANDEFDRILDVNYRASYYISRAASRIMKKQKKGRIVNIASIWSVITKPGRSLYCGSKSALVGMTRAIATELAQFNILVNCLSPGFVLTALTHKTLKPTEIEELSQQVPMKRFATPKEIANVVVFLCSEQNTYMTGQNVIIDGGFTNV